MSFKDIKGHGRSIKMLEAAFLRERKAPAYLFIGEDGIGKKLVARTLAKAINCLKNVFEASPSLGFEAKEGQAFDSCDICPSCKKIDNLNHPDIHWIMPDEINNSIKIEQIRQLKNDIYLRAYEARTKVFIIDDAHYLTAEAANAFLKILEEPPGESLIILISAKPKLIFPTILSRCQKIRFSTFSKKYLYDFLAADMKLNPELSHYLAYFCEGRLGQALSLKEGDILNEKNYRINSFIFSKDVYQEKELSRQRFRTDLNILASWFRDIYFIKTGLPYLELINFDRKDDLLKVMNRYSFLELDSIINFISESLLYLRQNINTKLILSNLKMKLCKD